MISVSSCSLLRGQTVIIDTKCTSGSFVDWTTKDITNASDTLVTWAFKHNAKLCECDWVASDPKKVEFCSTVKKGLENANP